MRLLLVVGVLACAMTVPARAAVTLGVPDDGRVRVNVPELASISSHMFVHYGEWVWAGAQAKTKLADAQWSGAIRKKEGDGPGGIDFVQTVTQLDDGIRLDFDFTREGEMALHRGVQLGLGFAFPDYEGRDVVFGHGPPATLDSNFNVPARRCTINLTDADALEISMPVATRFSTWINEGESISVQVRLAPRDMGPTGKASLTLRVVPAVRDVIRWEAGPSAEPLALRGATADRATAAQFEPIEFTLDLAATYDNPFDPDDVAVDAAFTTPSGRTEHVPGFYHQGFAAEYESGEELLSLEGGPAWKVRYTPREVGEYSVAFTCRDRTGGVEQEPMTFACAESDASGFIRMSDAHESGPKYFRTDTGESVFLIGHNVTSYVADAAEMFPKMKAGGENYTRLWMWSQSQGIEWGQPVGRYRMEEAWRLDRAFDLARQNGIYLMLCLDTHQDFQESWARNPYNTAKGGPCEEVMDFFTSEEARAIYRQRLRYLVARWGHRTNLLCWEFANEIEGYVGVPENKADMARWHADMARVVRELDPYDHPITSSQWTTEGWPEMWDLPEMEFVQSHYYANTDFADLAGDVAEICAQKLRDWPEKLHVFGEYGIHYKGGTGRVDPTGINLHNGNWAALMSGSASTTVSWWHRDYIDALDLYSVYRGIADYVAGEPLADRTWRILAPSINYVRVPPAAFTDFRCTGKASGWDAPLPEDLRFIIHRDGTAENLDKLPRLLQGPSHADLKSPFVFDLDCRGPSRFVVNVGEVSAGAVLDIFLDGERVASVDLPAAEGLGKRSVFQEQWDIWQTTYNESFGIDVPPGRHTVRLENNGRDWIQIGYFELADYLTNERPPVRVLGIGTDDRVLMWAQNKAHTWFKARDGAAIEAAPPTRVSVDGLADGRWRVEFWDTVSGRVTKADTVVVRGGQAEVTLPELQTDVAVKLLRL